MRSCVFAGTFDPITVGHAAVIDDCLKLFDKVTVVIAENKEKSPMFTLEERLSFIRAAYGGESRVEVTSCSGLLVDFMKSRGETVDVRGIRNADDYKYENLMSRYNSDMYPQLITVYSPTPPSVEHVSSSAIRSVIKLNADFSFYVPEKAYPLIVKALRTKR